VQGPLDSGSVVVTKCADPLDDVIQILSGDYVVAEESLAARQARLWETAKIHDDFEELGLVRHLLDRLTYSRGQHLQQQAQVVRYLELGLRDRMFGSVGH
jgi:hypothetical protein